MPDVITAFVEGLPIEEIDSPMQDPLELRLEARIGIMPIWTAELDEEVRIATRDVEVRASARGPENSKSHRTKATAGSRNVVLSL